MNRKYGLLAVLSAILCLQGNAQTSGDLIEGVVSYVTPQSVYVKFASTAHVTAGDTLFVLREDSLVPALIAKHTSSISVVAEPLEGITLKAGDKINSRVSVTEKVPRDSIPLAEVTPPEIEVPSVPVPEEDEPESQLPERRESIRGRISASMYSYLFNANETNAQRLRYTFSMQARNLNGSPFSAETYISFRHQYEDWRSEEIDMQKALRVYQFAGTYQTEKTMAVLGRKVNPMISNIGAIDGLQFTRSSGVMSFGAFAGFRPDHTDYGINTDLLQIGAYAGHVLKGSHGQIQTALAIVEQRNNGFTDRRFAYLQHASAPIDKISIFTSFEVDLYEKPDTVARNTFNLTSAYVSVQFRPSRKISVFGSYDARKNVIYFETYKNFIDDLIEQETRQGLRFRINYRPLKYLTINSSAGYRFETLRGANSMNMQHYISYTRVPWINASATVSATILDNEYLNGLIYGGKLSRNILKDKVYGEIELRKVHYSYGNSELGIDQMIAGINLSWRVMKKLSLSLDYEGIFEDDRSTNRMHINVIQRF